MVQKYINDLRGLIATDSKEGRGSEIYLTEGERAGTRTNQDPRGTNRRTHDEMRKTMHMKTFETIIKKKRRGKSAGWDQTNVRVLCPWMQRWVIR